MFQVSCSKITSYKTQILADTHKKMATETADFCTDTIRVVSGDLSLLIILKFFLYAKVKRIKF